MYKTLSHPHPQMPALSSVTVSFTAPCTTKELISHVKLKPSPFKMYLNSQVLHPLQLQVKEKLNTNFTQLEEDREAAT